MSFATNLASSWNFSPSELSYTCAGQGWNVLRLTYSCEHPIFLPENLLAEENRYPKSQQVLACAVHRHAYGSRGSQWENSCEKPAPEEQLNLYSKQRKRTEMDQRDKLRRTANSKPCMQSQCGCLWSESHGGKALSLQRMLGSQRQDQRAVCWTAQCVPTVLSCQMVPKIWE